MPPPVMVCGWVVGLGWTGGGVRWLTYQVGLLVGTTNVVDLAGHAPVQDDLEGAGDVLHLLK